MYKILIRISFRNNIIRVKRKKNNFKRFWHGRKGKNEFGIKFLILCSGKGRIQFFWSESYFASFVFEHYFNIGKFSILLPPTYFYLSVIEKLFRCYVIVAKKFDNGNATAMVKNINISG